MTITFKNMEFRIKNDMVFLTNFAGMTNDGGFSIAEVHICGRNKAGHLGTKMVSSSEGDKLRYVSHSIEDNKLVICQRSELVEVRSIYIAYDDCNVIRAYTQVENISHEVQTLEEVSAFMGVGIGDGIDKADSLYFTRFIQSHHAECQPIRYSFPELGLYRVRSESQKRISFANVGSWSTKEELPQGIIENSASGIFTMFQIESNNSWYYEIADIRDKYYLYLGGKNITFSGWSKELIPGETYTTNTVAVASDTSLNGVLAQMTRYRRHISGKCAADESLPGIYNEYMHLSWDSPEAENTRKYVPAVAQSGVEYYVIDCGWHDEVDGNIIYPYVGKWHESNKRFPDGVKEITDYIRSNGMKPGLWIEPEIIGQKCAEMLDFYDDDCFLQRNGKKIAVMGRYFLDYRNDKVKKYMSDTIRRMVEDYGADYIKFDYNQDCGIGTDLDSDSLGEGLEQAGEAFLRWVDEIREEHPHVIFEACASGGMRMDYATLSHFSIVSTSDQVDYKKYPYIASNILSAVLPEQAAVWSYPVDCLTEGEIPFTPDAEYAKANVDNEKVILNMVNCFLGRMHLASHLELLDDDKKELIREGVDYYKSVADAKKISVPYMPMGFTSYGQKTVASGFRTEDKLYLAVWNIGGSGAEITLEGLCPRSAKVSYPLNNTLNYHLHDNVLSVDFDCEYQARMFEIEL